MVVEIIKETIKDGKQTILLDDEDYNKIVNCKITLTLTKASRYKDAVYYVRFRLNGKRVFLHRWLLNCPDDKVVDHINHNPLDNRRCNLRVVSQRVNLMNKRNNTTSVPGVNYIKRDKIYRATIYVNNRLIHLGQSKDINVAMKLRKEAEKKYL